jgi:hypothetical protein
MNQVDKGIIFKSYHTLASKDDAVRVAIFDNRGLHYSHQLWFRIGSKMIGDDFAMACAISYHEEDWPNKRVRMEDNVELNYDAIGT